MRPAECRRRQEILRLSNAELARRSNLDKNTVGNCLAGRRDARLSTLTAIDEALTAAEIEARRLLAANGPGYRA